jgi:DNA-binding SARP family transcriptional activator/CheY-like chemotaxis protein
MSTSVSPSILVVGSDSGWLQVICDILNGEGHKPYPASTHKEVEQILQKQTFDVAVVDPILDVSKNFSPNDLVMLQSLQYQNPDVQIIIVSNPLSEDIRESISQLYPLVPILSKERWDKNYFISLVRSFAGEGPNTDDKRLRAILEQSWYGTRPLTSSPLERGVGRPRVLCVQDRSDWQQIFIEIFNTENYFWRMATSTNQALQILENENFHLVILDDHYLPMADSEISSQLLDYLIEFRPKTKVLVLIGRTSSDKISERLANYPVVRVMRKQSFDPDELKKAVVQATQAPQLKIESLGPFKIWRDGELIGHWQDPQAETLFKILLTRQATGGQAVSADELMELLWGKSATRDYKNLLPVINTARLTLEPGIDPQETSFILRNSTGYSLDIGGNVEWDVLKFRELMKEGKYLIDTQQWAEATKILEEVRALYKDDYLVEDAEANWALDLRRQLIKEYTGGLTDLADAYAAQGRYDDGIKICSETLVNDPLVESVYRRLMRFYYWKGHKEEALRTYRMCVKLFEELFGESPKPVTRQLYETIVRDKEVVNTLLL